MLFEKPGFQKQILGCNKYAKSNYLSVMVCILSVKTCKKWAECISTDRYTLIEQSVNHKKTLIEQSLHCC